MTATLKPKKKAVIQKGNGLSYEPATFAKEHAVKNFIEVDDPQVILDNIKPYELFGSKFIFFDTETHPYYKSSADVPVNVIRRWVGKGKKAVPQDYPFSMQLCDGVNAYCIYDTIANGFQKFKRLAPLFLEPTIEFVIHNAKFDMNMTQNIGMKIIGKIHDSIVLAKLANENRMSFQLRDLAARVEGGITKFEFMVDTYKQMNRIADYRDIPKELLTQYGCADVWNLFLVFVDEYTSLINQSKGETGEHTLVTLYEKEMEVMMTLYAMERRGMQTDAEYEYELKDGLQKTLDDAERDVYDTAGRVFNMNSNKQVYSVMLEMGVDPKIVKFSDKGNPKLDKYEMKKFDEVYGIPIISKILEYKKAYKLLNTYAVGIYAQVDEAGRCHGSTNQTEAVTGRMSITKPALQTLPKKDKRIRRMFIPRSEDYQLWFMDLDQIEYRGFGHYSKSSGLIEAINNGYDVHAATAAMVFHVPLDEIVNGLHEYDVVAENIKGLVDPNEIKKAEERLAYLQKYVDWRGSAKTINFAIIYGMGNEALANDLRITLAEAIRFKAQYFSQIPEAQPFINTVHAVIKQRGFVKNFYGRRRHLGSDDAYKAPNSLIQGWAADYIKDKMVNTYKYIQYNRLKTMLINIVHDELISEVHKSEVHLVPTFRYLLSDFDTYRCKITAGAEYGDVSWGQKKAPANDIGFDKPEDDAYLNYNLFDGHVFDINNKEAV